MIKSLVNRIAQRLQRQSVVLHKLGPGRVHLRLSQQTALRVAGALLPIRVEAAMSRVEAGLEKAACGVAFLTPHLLNPPDSIVLFLLEQRDILREQQLVL